MLKKLAVENLPLLIWSQDRNLGPNSSKIFGQFIPNFINCQGCDRLTSSLCCELTQNNALYLILIEIEFNLPIRKQFNDTATTLLVLK